MSSRFTSMSSLLVAVGAVPAAAVALAQSPAPSPQMDVERREMRVEIRMPDAGSPQIVINGEAVPPERLRRRPDGGFAILDRPGGEVIEVIPRIWAGPEGGMRGMDGPGSEMRPMVGVVMDRVDPLLARHLRLDPGGTILVAEVLPGSPAMEAGIQPGDLITGIAGGPATAERLAEAVDLAGVERRIGLEVIHEGESRRIEVTPRVMRRPQQVQREIRVEVDRDRGGRPEADRRRRGRGGMDAPMPHDDHGDGAWGDGAWMDEIEGLVEMLEGEIEMRADQFRQHLDGPWVDAHVHGPMQQFREQAERAYDEMMRHVEHLEHEMHRRLEDQMREFERNWSEWRREVERQVGEHLRERERMEQERERRRERPQRDRRPESRPA